ncbi:hypothetical protein CCP4SC76_2490008 [Gammaproteobacteria bacterium]
MNSPQLISGGQNSAFNVHDVHNIHEKPSDTSKIPPVGRFHECHEHYECRNPSFQPEKTISGIHHRPSSLPTIPDLILEARAAGIRLTLTYGQEVKLFADYSPPPEWLARLRDNKAAILAYLLGKRSPDQTAIPIQRAVVHFNPR